MAETRQATLGVVVSQKRGSLAGYENPSLQAEDLIENLRQVDQKRLDAGRHKREPEALEELRLYGNDLTLATRSALMKRLNKIVEENPANLPTQRRE